MQKDANIVFIEIYIVLVYIERLISTVCFFFIHFMLFGELYELVCKLHNKFLTCSETDTIFIFEGLYYCRLWKV